MSTDGDLAFMRRALALAEGRLGRTWPNPSVGCVIARGPDLVGEGVTGRGGRPHAEEMALDAAGAAARGATVYLTLEPCARRSIGGFSCAARLTAAGVGRVVAATGDPHANASGAGLDLLRAAGVTVETGLLAAEAEALNAGFINLVRTGMPKVWADDDGDRYDAPFEADAGADLRAALRRLGQAGLTRLHVRPGGPLALRLAEEGLLTSLAGPTS